MFPLCNIHDVFKLQQLNTHEVAPARVGRIGRKPTKQVVVMNTDREINKTLQILQEWFPKDLANVIREYYTDNTHIALGLYLCYLIDKHPNDVKLWNLWSTCKLEAEISIEDLKHCLNTYSFYESQLYNVVLDSVKQRCRFQSRMYESGREDREVFDVVIKINQQQIVSLINLFRQAVKMIENMSDFIYNEMLFDCNVAYDYYKLIVARPCSYLNIIHFIQAYLQSTNKSGESNILKTISITNNQQLNLLHTVRELHSQRAFGVNYNESFNGHGRESIPSVTFKFQLR